MKQLKINIQIKLEEYTFLVTYATKFKGEEWFYITGENHLDWRLIAQGQSLILSSFDTGEEENSLMEKLNKRKDFLKKLYTAIRNHPFCRLRMLNVLGPIKQY